MSDGSHLVFVYGTLRRGASNAFRMEGAEWLHPGFVKGRLYKVDWYPAVVLDDHAGKVEGELWRVSDEKLRELDAFEGGEYMRRKVSVFSGHSARGVNEWDGDQTEAWIWEWKGDVATLEFLNSGNWLFLEASEPRIFYTPLGCLSLFAMPIGGTVIANFVRRLFGWNVVLELLFSIIIFAGTPVIAWVLVHLGNRRKEAGLVWREMTTVISCIWIAVAAIGLFCKLLDLFAR